MYKFTRTILVLTTVALVQVADAANVPETMNIQGRLASSTGAPLPAGTKDFTFKIFDAAANGSVEWPGPAGETQSIQTDDDGLWNAILGAIIPLNEAVFADSNRWLEITVDDGSNPPETLPRVKLNTSPFSFMAISSRVADTALVLVDDGTYLPLTGGTMSGPIDNSGNPSITMGKGNFGENNTNAGNDAFVAGWLCKAEGGHSSVGGGQGNIAQGNFSHVGGGKSDSALGVFATVAGGTENTAGGDDTFVGGGSNNRATAFGAAVLGGTSNHANQVRSTVSGGHMNTANAQYSTVAGGEQNSANATHSFVSGGLADSIGGPGWYSVIGGGEQNFIYGKRAVVGGGSHNRVDGDFSAIIGGFADTISGTADYSYLFGIGSRLSEDSTFMVDMPHVVFGDEASGYEFPVARGGDGQVMSTNASGQLSWVDPPTGSASGWIDSGPIVTLTNLNDKVGIGLTNPETELDVSGRVHIADDDVSTTLEVVNSLKGNVNRLVNLERTDSVGGYNDILQIKVPLDSDPGLQFIECEYGVSVKFKVNGDGNVYADGAFTGPADFAEMIALSTGPQSAESGDVMVIDSENPNSVIKATAPRSRLAAGVYSTNPGFVGSRKDWDKAGGDEKGTYTMREMAEEFGEVPVAVMGIVPCKVSAENGAVEVGDLLVTSATPGHAMRDDDPKIGTVIAKALEPLESGTGVVNVLVTLQ